MPLSRRRTLQIGAAAALSLTSIAAAADIPEIDDLIAAFAKGAAPRNEKLTLTAPEIAENGNAVPVSVTVDAPMDGDDPVEAIMILADANPRPGVVTFRFSPASGVAAAATRMRLADTQNVIAVARTRNGQAYIDRRHVKVTIGGCGG